MVRQPPEEHQPGQRYRGVSGFKQTRNQEIWRKYMVYRWTQQRIADEYGITQQSVSEILAEIRAGLPKIDIDEIRIKSLELYTDLAAEARRIADLTPAPVTVGKDGNPLIDPESGEYVRDYRGRLAAMDAASRYEAEIRKLLGADAASKTETTGTVTYRVTGVDPDADLG